jgi:hypothetical protein
MSLHLGPNIPRQRVHFHWFGRGDFSWPSPWPVPNAVQRTRKAVSANNRYAVDPGRLSMQAQFTTTGTGNSYGKRSDLALGCRA